MRIVLASDRTRHLGTVDSLAPRMQYWGYGPTADIGDRPLKEVFDDPPELDRDDVIVIDMHPRYVERVTRELHEIYPRVAILLERRSIGDEERHDRFFVVDLVADFRQAISGHVELSRVRDRVEGLKTALESKGQVLILTHPNPDPDAIAAALGMRTVLGRNRQTAALGYLGRPLARPENVAMIELLEIDLERIGEKRLKSFDAVVLVDCQENVMAQYDLPEINAVIDHHPEQSQYTAGYRDIVPEEGSTSTIITRYLQALEIEPSQRLATALLYGVKSDTFFLKRGVNADDIASFLYLYPRANVNQLRRMEDPAMPVDHLNQMGRLLSEAATEGELFVAGTARKVGGEDIVARLSELGLQVRGAEWSLAYGVVGDSLVTSVRNVGYVRHAGRAVEAAFGSFGPAGGHRSAARAILDLSALRKTLGKSWAKELRTWMIAEFSEAISPEE